MEKTKPICCGKPMAKAGRAWSGTWKVQSYRCSQCGKRVNDTSDKVKPNKK